MAMASHIKALPGRFRIAFGRGRFDSWCVFIKRPDKQWHAPRDRQVFGFFAKQAVVFGNERIYRDFVRIFERTGSELDAVLLHEIDVISNGYGEKGPDFNLWFTVIYAGMVAEEKKKNAVLKKRIKRLGMHQLLMEGFSPEKAARFSRGKKDWMLDLICRRRGF